MKSTNDKSGDIIISNLQKEGLARFLCLMAYQPPRVI